MNRDITIQLDTPLQRGNQTLTEITLRKPNAGELIGISLAAMLQIDVETQATSSRASARRRLHGPMCSAWIRPISCSSGWS